VATTGNTRDVRMQLSVDTLGEENISKLGSLVRELARSGGDAAPEFAKLADEIDRLGEQAKALKVFQTLSDDTAALTAVQDRAAATTAELRAKLEELSASTAQARERQQGTVAALREAEVAYRQTRDAIAKLNIETTGAARKEEDYIAQKRALSLAAIEQRARTRELRDELGEVNATVQVAIRAESDLAKSYARSAQEADKTAKALNEHAAAVHAAEQAALELGVATDNIAGSQAEITLALNKVGTAAETLRERLERLAAREREIVEIRAFEKLAQEAQELVRASQYADLFDQALARSTVAQRDAKAAAEAAQWQKQAFEIVEAAEAAQRLARETEITAAVMRELAAIDAFEKQANDAKQLLQAADYVQFWTNELNKSEAQLKETAAASESAASRIKSAFQTIGTKSAAELRAEIAAVRAALVTVETEAGVTGSALSSAFTAGKSRINELERELRAVNGQLTSGDKLAGLFKNSLGQIAAGNIIADGVGYLVNKIKELGVAAIAAIVQIDQLRRGLGAVYQSSAIAAAQILFLKRTSMEAGVAFGSISQAFVKFSAATQSANIPLNVTNGLFASIARAASTLGLSGDEVTGMLNALGQMASKGTVSMEELRQQLGDRLPGALSLVAKGLGLTDAQLIKLVESGGLAARDLFPALTKALNQMQGEAQGLVPTYERLKNALTEAAQAGGDSGWTQVLVGGLKALAIVLGTIIIPFQAFTELVFGLAKAAAVAAAALTGDIKVMEELGKIADDAATRQANLTKAFQAAAGEVDVAAQAQAAHTEKMVATGKAAANLEQAVISTSAAQQANAFATKVMSDNTLDLSSKIVQVKANIDELLASQVKDTDAKTKLVQAAKLEGDALKELAALRGSEQATLVASVQAQERSLTALTNLAEAHKTETELLELKLDVVTKAAIQQDGNTKARQTEIDDIKKKIVVSKAETEQSKQAEAQARAELAVRRLQQQAYQDNSARVDEYARALLAATTAVDELTRRSINQTVSDEQMRAAKLRLSEAQFLFNDAVKDTIAKIDQENRLKQASINVAQAKISVEQQSLLATAGLLRSMGNVASAIEFEISAKYKQIEATRLVATAKKAEAQATIDAANEEIKALDVNDKMYKQKRAEIEIRLQNAKAKLIEANASESVISGIQREIDALRKQQYERKGSSDSIERDTQSRDTNTSAINRQTQALKEQKQMTADGFEANPDGSAKGSFNNMLPVDQAFALANGQITDKGAAAAALQQAKNAYEDMLAFTKLNPGASSYEYQTSTRELYTRARAAYEKLTAASVGGGTTTGGGPASIGGGAAVAPGGAASVGGTRVIRIDIGGESFNVTSQQDADAVERVIRTLAQNKGAAA
jgi:tape measure domain-containing protein